jgi:ABC-2 type transport system ATP-binding protein
MHPVGAEHAIETISLVKRYGSTSALDGVDLVVPRGAVFGYLGPNGSGKTTTIRLLLGLVRPDRGSVRLFGEPVTIAHRPGKVGALVERPAFYPYLDALDNLRLLGAAARLPARVVEKRARTVLDRLGLSEVGRRRVGGYSTGMKQRLAIAASLLDEPDLLVLDEPTDGLDAAGITAVRELIRELAGAGTTVFLSSHLLAEVEQVCTRLAVLANGRIVAEGSTADLIGEGSRVTATFSTREVSNRAISLLAEHGIHAALADRTNSDEIRIDSLDVERVLGLLALDGVFPMEIALERRSLEARYLALTEEPGGRPSDA